MAAKFALLLAVTIAMAASATAADKKCLEYPFGYGYEYMSDLFATVKACLDTIDVNSDKCSYVGVRGRVLGQEHERYLTKGREIAIPFILDCLKSSSVDQARVQIAEACLWRDLPHHST